MDIRPYHSADLSRVVALWNDAARECFGFFPLTEKIFHDHVLAAPFFQPPRLLLAWEKEALVGMIHFDVVEVAPYPRAGVVAAIMTRSDRRRQGIGKTLLQTALAPMRGEATYFAALGCWPYSSFYAGLIDGSERSGIDRRNAAAQNLFASAGFTRGRRSLIMRGALSPPDDKVEIAADFYREKYPEAGQWLDVATRHWTPSRQILLDAAGHGLSYATYARMDGYAEFCGKEIYAVYAVRTPAICRRRGYARRNLLALQRHLAALGGEMIEVHVYADNDAGIKLYQSLGFATVGESESWQLKLPAREGNYAE
ncbi:hypothetical protein FACS1894139_05200 [Planctomycetales bacterium]|nr:hypothetical protein FACS1894107_03060 [Planctomycetales bacterium]GHS97109.1 hypothetical protein FACS1894108_02940 [Planctomycetales bacterium]GHT03905.1 hypothetical protein FACS1894139_05200 [Planctomycetales bacterium]